MDENIPCSEQEGNASRNKLTAEQKAYARLETFVTNFVINFKAELDKLPKELYKKDPTTYVETAVKMGVETIKVVAASLTISLVPALEPVTKLAGKGLDKARVKVLKENNKPTDLAALLADSARQSQDHDWVLILAGYDIFQSFEKQFMSITGDEPDVWRDAIALLAKEASDRAIEYYTREEAEKAQVSRAVIWGNSPKHSDENLTLIGSIKYAGQLSNVDWITSSMYDCIGLTREKNKSIRYYKKKNREKCEPTIYEYRRLLEADDWRELKSEYNMLEIDQVDTSSSKVDGNDCIYAAGGLKDTHVATLLAQIKRVEKDEKRKAERKETFEPIRELCQELNLEKRVSHSEKQMQETILFQYRDMDVVNPFIGREKQMQELKDELSDTTTGKRSMAVISGLGGIGKSQLAKMYAQNFRASCKGNVVWINSGTNQLLCESFRTFDEELHMNTMNTVKDGNKGRHKDGGRHGRHMSEIVKEVFETCDKNVHKSLFVFDNAENYKGEDGIRDFLPPSFESGKFQVIITSRKRNWDLQLKQIQLALFTVEESVELVNKKLELAAANLKHEKNDQEQQIKELGTKLNLPLALQLAIAYIIEQDMTVSEYLEEFTNEEERVNLLNYEFPDWNMDTYEQTLFASWRVTFDKLRKEQNGLKATEILNVIAFFFPDNIPETLIKSLGTESEIKLAVKLLSNYSVIDKKEGLLSVHRLIQDTIRSQIKNDNIEKNILKKALQLFKDQKISLDVIDSFQQHTLSIWNYALHYPELIEEFQKHPLHYSCRQGLLEAVKYVIDDYPNINKADPYGKSALYRAVQGEHWEVAEYVIKQMKHGEFDGWKYMLLAIGLPNKDIIKYLINTNTDCDYNGVTFLYRAALDGNYSVVKFLIDKGVDVLAFDRGDSEVTLLHQSVYSDNEDIISLILSKVKEELKADWNLMSKYINYKDKKGDTALMWAAQGGRSNAARILLDDYVTNIGIDHVNKDEETALHWIAKKKVAEDEEAENWLEYVAASDWMKNEEEKKKAKEEDELKWSQKKLDIARLLLGLGPNLKMKDSNGKTPLEVARDEGCLDIVTLLEEFEENGGSN